MDEEVRRKITRARSQLILHKPFWGYLACYLEPKEDKNLLCKTAGVDGKYLYYDPDYIRELDMECLQGLIGHEVYHCAFNHIGRRGARDPIRWNLAADVVSNSHLLTEGFKLPSGGLMVDAPHDEIEEARKLSVEEAYEKIKPPPGGGQGKGKGKGTISLPSKGETSLDGELLDDHDVWDRDGGEKGELEKASAKKDIEQRWREYVSRARQIVKSQGKGMGNLDEEIDELLEPRMPWQEILRNSILTSAKNDYRLCPPNRRHIWRGIYLPSIYGESVEVGFCVDTSGSMSKDEVLEGLSEVRAICEQFSDFKVHFWQADYGIQEYRELTPYSFDFPDKIRGRGGTSFREVFNDVIEKSLAISCLIYVTDGYGTFPESPPDYPVIWLTHKRDVTFPFGLVLYLDKI